MLLFAMSGHKSNGWETLTTIWAALRVLTSMLPLQKLRALNNDIPHHFLLRFFLLPPLGVAPAGFGGLSAL